MAAERDARKWGWPLYVTGEKVLHADHTPGLLHEWCIDCDTSGVCVPVTMVPHERGDVHPDVLAAAGLLSGEGLAALRSALERTEANLIAAVNGKPVRDMAENLAENRAALAAGRGIATEAAGTS